MSILPFFFSSAIGFDGRFVRIFRLFRVSRILKLGKFSKSFEILGEGISNVKKELINRSGNIKTDFERIEKADFIVVSHNGANDPILNYGNQVALKLWELNWDDFIKKNPLPIAKPQPTQKRPEPRARVIIDPNDYTIPDIQFANPQTPSTTVNQNELKKYLSSVKAQLEAVWQRLLAQAGLTSGGETKVQFRISSTGIILDPSIVRRSGNPTLDKLVIQVCRSVGNVGRPPGGGIDSPLALPFRVN